MIVELLNLSLVTMIDDKASVVELGAIEAHEVTNKVRLIASSLVFNIEINFHILIVRLPLL
jgi:hypothetical protein